MRLSIRRLPALFSLGATLLLFACGKPTAPAPAPAPDPEECPVAQAAEPPAVAGGSEARRAFKAFLALGEDADVGDVDERLSSGYRAHLMENALSLRDEILQAKSDAGPEEIVRRLREILKKRKKGRKDGEEDEDGEVVIEIGDDFMKKYGEESQKRAQALFGVDLETLGGLGEEEIYRLWLQRHWRDQVRPDLAAGYVGREIDRVDRVVLFVETGRGPATEVILVLERGAFRYGGTWRERETWRVGPERAALYDWKTAAQQREAAELDLSMLQEGLMEFRRHMERYPAGVEGLEGLLENPGGRDAPKWLGPYVHHIHDPWGRRFRLEVPGKNNPSFYDLWSAGPDGLDGTADDLRNW